MFNVELLLFDLDGTLCDTKNDLALSVNLTLKELGIPEKPFEEIYGFVGSGVRRLLQQAVEEESGERFDRAMRVFRGYYMKHLLDTTALYPGMEGVLDHFAEKKKAVVTNKPYDYTSRMLDGLGLTSRFDLVVGGNNGIPLKPDPGMILFALDHLKVKKSDCVLIGDGLQDISAARASGIKVCAVRYGLGDPTLLEEAGPDFLCRQPEDLKCLFE